MAQIRQKLPTKTAKQKEVKKIFLITDTEELKELLEMFEWVTDEVQTNKVSISKVYPCVNYLKKGLSSVGSYQFTKNMRKELLNASKRMMFIYQLLIQIQT